MPRTHVRVTWKLRRGDTFVTQHAESGLQSTNTRRRTSCTFATGVVISMGEHQRYTWEEGDRYMHLETYNDDDPSDFAESAPGVDVVDVRSILESPHAVDVMAEQLRAAEAAHARYSEHHDGGDWPTWYARYMLHLKPEIEW